MKLSDFDWKGLFLSSFNRFVVEWGRDVESWRGATDERWTGKKEYGQNILFSRGPSTVDNAKKTIETVAGSAARTFLIEKINNNAVMSGDIRFEVKDTPEGEMIRYSFTLEAPQ